MSQNSTAPRAFRAAPSRLPKAHDTGVFEGRDQEMEWLDAAWADPQKHVITLVAIGGAGKTTLAARWAAKLLARHDSGMERYFDWSFYSQGTREDGKKHTTASSDDFFTMALEFFRPEDNHDNLPISPWEKGAQLAEWIAKQRTLLILDGLEPLQQPPGPLGGQLVDEALRALLNGLAAHNAGLCLITTRTSITDLRTWQESTAPERKLENLSERAGAVLLRKLGVTGLQDALEKASCEVKGHALTLSLMGRYLKLAFADNPDIARRGCFKFQAADAAVQNGHAFRIIEAYEKWLDGKPPKLDRTGRRFAKKQQPTDNQIALSILRLLGLFDRPATPDCLAALRYPPIPGLTDKLADLSEARWNLAVSRLQELDLIETASWRPKKVAGYNKDIARRAMEAAKQRIEGYLLGEPQLSEDMPHVSPRGLAIDAHPVLREYFASRLEKDTALWRTAHARLFEYLCSSVPYWPEGADGLQALYQAVAHGCHAGRHQQACDEVYRHRIQRGYLAYPINQLGLFGADLGAVACFFVEPWQKLAPSLPPGAQRWLLSEAAFRLRALNRLVEAQEPMRAAISMGRAQWNDDATLMSNLSEMELALGDVSGAVRLAAQSVVVADRSGDAFQRICTRTTYADTLHQEGRARESLALFIEAEAMQAKLQPDAPLLYSLRGFQYCEQLLADIERAVWCVGLRATVADARPAETRMLDSVLDAIEHRANDALPIATRFQWLLSMALHHLTRGRTSLYRVILQVNSFHLPRRDFADQSRQHLSRAVATLRQAGHQEHLPGGLLTLAWLHVVEGDTSMARTLLTQTQALAERGGMLLHLADVYLHRARLFFREDLAAARDDLAKARALIEQTGYGRRIPELVDAEAVIKS